MQITLTAKVQILPDVNNTELLYETMLAYKKACNFVSMHIFSTQTMNLRELQKELYYELRDRFNLRSQMAISVLRTVRAKYAILDSNNQPWTCIAFNKPQLDLVWNRDYTLLGNVFSLNTLEGRIKLPFSNPVFSLDGKFGTARLVYRHNKFFLHIPVTHEIPDVSEYDIKNVVGIDRGIRFVATTYDSNGKTVFYSGAYINNKRRHYSTIKKELKNIGTASSRRRLKELGRREHRWMQDVNHCISKALTESQPRGTLFVLEDLHGIKSRVRSFVSNNQYLLSSWSYFDLEEKLIYKAALRGQVVIKVDPAYTSQTCPLCGKRNKSSRLKHKHIFRCTSCRYKSNDDRVAAINLYSKGIQYLIQSGKSMLFFGRA